MTTNQSNQVQQLNSIVLVRIAPSKIAGVGVFAIRDLKKGTKLYADNIPRVFDLSYGNFSKLWPEVKQILLEQFPNIVNGSAFVWPTTRYMAYMNHSENYNYIAEDDELIKDVKAGEEITENYRFIPGAEKVFPWLK